MFQRKDQIEEVKEFIESYSGLFEFLVQKLQTVELKDAIAHLLSEVMQGIDQARLGKKAGKDEAWTREQVIELVKALNVAKKRE